MKVPKEVLLALHEAAQRFVTDKEMQEFFDDAKKHAMAIMEEDGAVMVTFLAHMRRREDADKTKEKWIVAPIVLADWPPDNKYEVIEGLGRKLAKDFEDYILVCVVQISEAWMAGYASEDIDPTLPNVPKNVPMPSQRDDKMEVLHIDAVTIDRRISSSNIPMIRKANGEFATWGRHMDNPYDPKDIDGDIEQTNFLIMQMFKGSLGVASERQDAKARGEKPAPKAEEPKGIHKLTTDDLEVKKK